MNMCNTNPAAFLRAQNTCVYVTSHLIHPQQFLHFSSCFLIFFIVFIFHVSSFFQLLKEKFFLQILNYFSFFHFFHFSLFSFFHVFHFPFSFCHCFQIIFSFLHFYIFTFFLCEFPSQSREGSRPKHAGSCVQGTSDHCHCLFCFLHLHMSFTRGPHSSCSCVRCPRNVRRSWHGHQRQSQQSTRLPQRTFSHVRPVLPKAPVHRQPVRRVSTTQARIPREGSLESRRSSLGRAGHSEGLWSRPQDTFWRSQAVPNSRRDSRRTHMIFTDQLQRSAGALNVMSLLKPTASAVAI